jgi:hypothetical protein
MKRWLLFLLIGPCFHIFGQEVPDSMAMRKEQTIVTEPATLYKGILRIALGTELRFLNKRFVDGKKQPIDENIWGSNIVSFVSAGYGVTERLMLKIVVPYVRADYYQTPLYLFPTNTNQQYSYPQRWKTQARGIGDVDLSAGYQIIQENKSRPAIVASVSATLPTGRKDVTDDGDDVDHTYDLPTGQGAFAFETALMIRKISYPYTCSATVFYIYQSEANKVTGLGEASANVQNGQTLGASASLNVQLSNWVAFANNLDLLRSGGQTKDGAPAGGAGWLLQYLPGLSFQLKKLRIDQGMMIALKGNNMDADPAYHLLLQYSF